jgi:regulator of sigma E protease
MQVLKVIFIILEVIILFNLLIIVHELGHFLAAKWRGLKVEKFAIWFGKPLWQKEINGVVYALGSIPAGGFVAIPQMAPMEAIEGQSQSTAEPLPPIGALDKIIVAFAGPLFSFGLAIVFAFIVWGVGRPVSEAETTTTIGFVHPGSPAAKAGLQAGDRILKVDGNPVNRFGGMGDSVTWHVVSSSGDTILLEIERDGQILQLESGYVRAQTKAWQRSALRQILIEPEKTALVARVMPNSPADAAGIRPSDVILAVDGEPIRSPAALGERVQAVGTNTPVTLTIERGPDTLTTTVLAEYPVYPPEYPNEDKRPLIGIEWERSGRFSIDHPGPLVQVASSVQAMVRTFQALFTPKSDVKAQHLSGFVGIMRIYYVLFEDEHGWRQALWFSVILNVNLALLNLLPIPILDGGHILLALIEAVRRRPISVRTLSVVQGTCAFALIGYMLYITVFDVQDLPWRSAPQERIHFEPRPVPSAVVPVNPGAVP